MHGHVGPPVPGVSTIEIDGRVSVYDPSTAQLIALNETATDVWWLCDGEHDLSGIVSRLAASYRVEPTLVVDDVRSAVSALVDLGLLPEPSAT